MLQNQCSNSNVAGWPPSMTSSFTLPPNARVERFVTHRPVLERAACVVCHGGMGITQKAPAAGVPACVVPFGRDQLEVARHVEVADAGTRLPAGRLRPDRLRSSVREATTKKGEPHRCGLRCSWWSEGGCRHAGGNDNRFRRPTRCPR